MATNKIQIKRSTANATVTGLANGELAYTQATHILYIGAPDGTGSIPIGGKYFPGVLTANHVLVANATSGIDKIIVANAVITNIWANGAGGTAGQILVSNSSGGLYWTTSTYGVTGANTQVQFNDSGVFGASAGLTFNKTSNTLTVANNITAVDLSITGNTTLGDAATDKVTINAGIGSNLIPTANITYSLGNTVNMWQQGHFANLHAVTGVFDGSVTVAGDIIVSGNLTTTNVNSVVVADPMVFFAANNTASDTLDIGFAGNYFDGTTIRRTGLFRDATDGVWKLFANTTQDIVANNTVNTAAIGYGFGVLQTYLDTGGLKANGTNVVITANSTLAVAITANTISSGSLTLTTALAGTSGGTGKSTVANWSLLAGNTTNGYQELALNTNAGYVLQSNGSAIVYDTLDGGTF